MGDGTSFSKEEYGKQIIEIIGFKYGILYDDIVDAIVKIYR